MKALLPFNFMSVTGKTWEKEPWSLSGACGLDWQWWGSLMLTACTSSLPRGLCHLHSFYYFCFKASLWKVTLSWLGLRASFQPCTAFLLKCSAWHPSIVKSTTTSKRYSNKTTPYLANIQKCSLLISSPTRLVGLHRIFDFSSNSRLCCRFVSPQKVNSSEHQTLLNFSSWLTCYTS